MPPFIYIYTCIPYHIYVWTYVPSQKQMLLCCTWWQLITPLTSFTLLLIKAFGAAGWNGSWEVQAYRGLWESNMGGEKSKKKKRCLAVELRLKWVFNHAVNVGEMWSPETAQIASMRCKTPSGEPNGQITLYQMASWRGIKCIFVDTLTSAISPKLI